MGLTNAVFGMHVGHYRQPSRGRSHGSGRRRVSLLKRPQVLMAIVLFVAPAATFSLTNFIAGSFAADAAVSLTASLLLAAGLLWHARRSS
jgi:hypothetical protein